MTPDQVSKFYQGNRVVVTGGGGFIGSHLVEELVRQGAHVRALLRYTSSAALGNLAHLPADVFSQVEVVHGNVEDYNSVRSVCQKAGVVFHLAALIGIPYSYVAPRQYVSTNVIGTTNVLDAVRELGIPKMVHTSTSETYGTSIGREMTEEHPLSGQSPYSASKIAADKFAESYYLSFGTPVATIRPFNTYGPRQSTRAVIPSIIRQLVAKRREIKVGSIVPVRDFNYVTDTVAGFLGIGASEDCVGKTLNISSGRAVSIGETADLLLKISGREAQLLTEQARVRPDRSEVMFLLGDHRLAKRIIGYEPKVSLEDGLRRTFQYFQQTLDPTLNVDRYAI